MPQPGACKLNIVYLALSRLVDIGNVEFPGFDLLPFVESAHGDE